MSFLPAKIIEGLLVIACTSLYTYMFSEGTVGSFTILNTNVQMVYLVLAGWMTNAVARYAGEEHSKNKGRHLFSTMFGFYVAICAVVAASCIIAVICTGNPIYFGFAFMFFVYTVFQILNAALVQLGLVRQSIILSLTSAALKMIVAYVLVLMFHATETPAAAICANVVADAFASIGAIVVLSLVQNVRLRWFSKPLFKKFFAYGVPLMGVSIAVALLNRIDAYLVFGLFGDEVYAVYSTNNSIASGLFTMISVGIMRGVYPTVLSTWREGGLKLAQPMLDKGTRLYLLIAVPAACGLSAVSLTMSRVFFREGYDAGAAVIAYTAIAMLFMGLTEYANKAYELEQKTIHVLQNSAAAAVIKVIASVILLKTVGFTGGALGSIVAFASYFFITYFRVRKRFVFHIPAKSVVRIVMSGALCGAAAYGCTLLDMPNVIRLVLAVVAGALVYAVCILASGEGKEEMQAVMKKIRG